MSRFLRKAALIILVFILASPLYAALGPIAVTLCTNSNIEIIYYRDKGQSIRLDTSKSLSANVGDEIYYKIRIKNPDIYEFLGFRIVEHVDGVRSESVILPDNGSIVLPRNFRDISIEPIGEYRKRNIQLSDSADGKELNGIWRVNDENLSAQSLSLSPLEKYLVSYTYDSNLYYLISAEPAKKVFAISEGSVVFSPENPKTAKDPATSYSIVLENYTRLSVDNPSRVKRVILNDGSEISGTYLSDHKLRSGDSITIETALDYRLRSEALELEETAVLDDRRVFALTIPEDNDNYSIELRTERIAMKNIAVSIEGATDNTAFTLSTGRAAYTLADIERNGSAVLSEGNILYFENNTESKNERMLITVESENDDASLYAYEIGRGEAISFRFQDASDITVSVETGFRYTPPQNNISDAKVKYYLGGNELEAGTFIKSGSVVEIKAEVPPHLILSGKNFPRGSYESSFTVTPETTSNDFRLISSNREGLYFDPADYTFEEGTVIFTLNGIDITSRIFIESGNTISYRAQSIKEGYRFDDGDIIVKGRDITQSLLNEIRFREQIVSDISITYPRYGGSVSALYNGNIISADSISLFAGERIDLIYYPAQGWYRNTDKTKSPDYIIAEGRAELVDLSNAFIERDYHKRDVKVTIYENLGKDFMIDLSSIGRGELEYIETKGIFGKNSSYTHDIGKVDSTSILFSIYGNHLKADEALAASVIIRDSKNAVIGKYGALFVYPQFTYLFDGFVEEAASFEFVFSMVPASGYEEAHLENGRVRLYTGSELIENGNIVELDGMVTYTIEADEGHRLYIGGVQKDGIYKSAQMTYRSYLETIDYMLSETESKKVYSLELFYGDYDESCIYRLNDRIVSGNIIEFVEGDKLELSYTAPAGHRVNNASIFNSRKTSGAIYLNEENDGDLIDKFSFGIITMKEVR